MKHGTRLTSSVCLAASVALCLTISFYSSAHAIPPAHSTSETGTGSVVSSPRSGPVGAIIAISGSGWHGPDGEQVAFGYMIESHCSIVTDSQTAKLHDGSFNGWFRWPVGTPLATYSVCATFGSTTALAGTYKVLSESAPHASISPSILTAGTQATITGSNYYPAGSTVQLSWETPNGSVNFSLSPAISNSKGLISRTFVVPATSLASGPYKIVAFVGKGQPPTLSSSTTFTYNAPVPNPSPTPIPGPDPTPAQQLLPAATITAVTSPVTTPTIGSTTSTGSQNSGTSQTPASGTGTTTTTTNQPASILPVVGVTAFLSLLATTLIIVLLVRRKKAHSREIIVGAGSPTTGSMPFPVNNDLNIPIQSWPVPTANRGSMSPVLVGQVAQTTGSSPPLSNQSTSLSLQQLQVSPYTYLLRQPAGGSPGAVDDHPTLGPNDPNFEAIKRQVQIGLYAIPGQRWNDESSG